MLRRLSLILSLLIAAPAAARAPATTYERGMVSAADPRAAEAGVAMLRATFRSDAKVRVHCIDHVRMYKCRPLQSFVVN